MPSAIALKALLYLHMQIYANFRPLEFGDLDFEPQPWIPSTPMISIVVCAPVRTMFQLFFEEFLPVSEEIKEPGA